MQDRLAHQIDPFLKDVRAFALGSRKADREPRNRRGQCAMTFTLSFGNQAQRKTKLIEWLCDHALKS